MSALLEEPNKLESFAAATMPRALLQNVTPADGRLRLAARGETGAPVVDIVIPVYNEMAGLDASVRRLHAYLDQQLPTTFRITVVDNASIDATWDVAHTLNSELNNVACLRLPLKGRGRALHASWSTSDAQILAYMDVDLSTDLAALLPLIAPLLSGHSNVAIGSRLAPGARIVRGMKRDLISRTYNMILRASLGVAFTDAQCGFKAIRRDAAQLLLPLVEDQEWFFDTELLVLAERAGLRIHEVPVDWIDDPDSRVDIIDTAIKDLKGVARVNMALHKGKMPLEEIGARMGRGPIGSRPTPSSTGQLLRFAGVGVASTLAYLLIFWALRGAMGAQYANVIALLLTAFANTAANRRLTFGVHGRAGAARQQMQGLVVFALGLGITAGSLALLSATTVDPSRFTELTVLILANALATVVRFVLFRGWIFSRGGAR
jgi:putative flippase GtrA